MDDNVFASYIRGNVNQPALHKSAESPRRFSLTRQTNVRETSEAGLHHQTLEKRFYILAMLEKTRGGGIAIQEACSISLLVHRRWRCSYRIM